LLQQVIDAIAALPNAAAAGRDGITAAMKVSLVTAERLLSVIVAVWRFGKVPVDWKRADMVPAYRGTGSAKLGSSHRPISLLSVPGKVYAWFVLHHAREQVDSQLLESQRAFKKSRRLNDAAFLRSILQESSQGKQPLNLAFVDLSKPNFDF
jgi:hypothetical protein